MDGIQVGRQTLRVTKSNKTMGVAQIFDMLGEHLKPRKTPTPDVQPSTREERLEQPNRKRRIKRRQQPRHPPHPLSNSNQRQPVVNPTRGPMRTIMQDIQEMGHPTLGRTQTGHKTPTWDGAQGRTIHTTIHGGVMTQEPYIQEKAKGTEKVKDRYNMSPVVSQGRAKEGKETNLRIQWPLSRYKNQ